MNASTEDGQQGNGYSPDGRTPDPTHDRMDYMPDFTTDPNMPVINGIPRGYPYKSSDGLHLDGINPRTGEIIKKPIGI
jgi:hypothetical protein